MLQRTSSRYLSILARLSLYDILELICPSFFARSIAFFACSFQALNNDTFKKFSCCLCFVSPYWLYFSFYLCLDVLHRSLNIVLKYTMRVSEFSSLDRARSQSVTSFQGTGCIKMYDLSLSPPLFKCHNLTGVLRMRHCTKDSELETLV